MTLDTFSGGCATLAQAEAAPGIGAPLAEAAVGTRVFCLLSLLPGRENKPVRCYLEAHPVLIKKLLSRFSTLTDHGYPSPLQSGLWTSDNRHQTFSKGRQKLIPLLNFV